MGYRRGRWVGRHRMAAVRPSLVAVAIEQDASRAARIARNALALGVPHLRIVEGVAPAALAGLPRPDAIFVGGGGSEEGVMDAAIFDLRPGGRLVANAVTLETEAVLLALQARLGGDLVRLAVSRAVPVKGMTGWRPAMPVTNGSGPRAKRHDRGGRGQQAGRLPAGCVCAIDAALARAGLSRARLEAIATPAIKGGEVGIAEAAATLGLPLILVPAKPAGSHVWPDANPFGTGRGTPARAVRRRDRRACGRRHFCASARSRLALGAVTCALAEGGSS